MECHIAENAGLRKFLNGLVILILKQEKKSIERFVLQTHVDTVIIIINLSLVFITHLLQILDAKDAAKPQIILTSLGDYYDRINFSLHIEFLYPYSRAF